MPILSIMWLLFSSTSQFLQFQFLHVALQKQETIIWARIRADFWRFCKKKYNYCWLSFGARFICWLWSGRVFLLFLVLFFFFVWFLIFIWEWFGYILTAKFMGLLSLISLLRVFFDSSFGGNHLMEFEEIQKSNQTWNLRSSPVKLWKLDGGRVWLCIVKEGIPKISSFLPLSVLQDASNLIFINKKRFMGLFEHINHLKTFQKNISKGNSKTISKSNSKSYFKTFITSILITKSLKSSINSL